MTTGEDERPYIAVRMRQEDKKENKVHKERKEQRVIVENKEEEQYMTVDEDGRPYIAVRKEETRGQTRKGRTRVENRYRKRESRAADRRRNRNRRAIHDHPGRWEIVHCSNDLTETRERG